MLDTKKSVQEFITAFDANPDWAALVQEEAKEVLEAVSNLLKEVTDLVYVMDGYVITNGEPDDDAAVITKEVNAAVQWVESLGLIFDITAAEEAFRRVHASNMSKLDDNGKPIRRADGKILKGPNYKPPVLSDLVMLP